MNREFEQEALTAKRKQKLKLKILLQGLCGVSPKIDLIEMNRILYRLLLAFTQLSMRMTNFSSTAARSFYHQIYPPY